MLVNTNRQLTKKETDDLLMKEDRNSVVCEIFEGNLNLVLFLANKYRKENYDIDDIISEGSIGLLKAIRTFKFEHNVNFSAYASKCITNEIKVFFMSKAKESLFNKSNTYSCNEFIDVGDHEIEVIDTIPSTEDHFEDYRAEMLLAQIPNLLNTREKFVFNEVILKGRQQNEIHEEIGVSSSYISRIYINIKYKVYDFLKEV